MIEDLVQGPVLWFLNRGSGFAVLALLTLSTLLGIASTAGRGSGNTTRRFASQALHRNVSLLAVVFLAIHVTTAVVDDYVDIRWWHVISPVGASYQPLWLGLGALGFDLIAAVVATSLLRARMSHRPWRLVHLTSYAAWALGIAHGLGIGTDMDGTGALGVRFTVGCAVVVCAAAAVRILAARRGQVAKEPA